MPLRTIARITAFRPGQSPPPVSTPMRIVNGKYSGHATALLLAALAVLAGCGSGEKKDDRARGATLTIYTSLPRHGVSARAGDAVAAGERLPPPPPPPPPGGGGARPGAPGGPPPPEAGAAAPPPPRR